MEKKQNTSFFDSILANEEKHNQVIRIRHMGERVSIVLQALLERDMIADYYHCQEAVSELVQKYCLKVEQDHSKKNALPSTSSHSEPEV